MLRRDDPWRSLVLELNSKETGLRVVHVLLSLGIFMLHLFLRFSGVQMWFRFSISFTSIVYLAASIVRDNHNSLLESVIDNVL